MPDGRIVVIVDRGGTAMWTLILDGRASRYRTFAEACRAIPADYDGDWELIQD